MLVPGLAVKYEQIPAGQVLSSSVEFMGSLMLQPRVKLGMQALFFSLFLRIRKL